MGPVAVAPLASLPGRLICPGVGPRLHVIATRGSKLDRVAWPVLTRRLLLRRAVPQDTSRSIARRSTGLTDWPSRDLEAELGWCLDPRYGGSGYATEAVEAAERRVRSRIADGLSDHASGPGTRAHQRRKTAPTAPPITSSSATRTSAGIPSRTIPTPAALSAEGSLEVTIAVAHQKRRTPAPAGADVATVRQDRSLPRTAPQARVDRPCQHASCTHLPARDQRT